MDVVISPSVLSAQLLNLKEELEQVEQAGADWHHVDVMDGHFVPNLTFGLPMVEALRKATHCPLDVHLMVSNPEVVIPSYIQAGAHMITFHWEAALHHHRLLQLIRSHGVLAGIALNPSTPVFVLEDILGECDLVLIMSVNPGFSGQAFIPQTLHKVDQLHKRLCQISKQDSVRIMVDGGVNPSNTKALYEAGARGFVAGNAVYKASNKKEVLEKMKQPGASS